MDEVRELTAAQEQSVELTVRGPDGREWKLPLLIAITVVSMIVAGTTIGWTLTQREVAANEAEVKVEQNRDTLIALCSSLTTLRFVFEQLEVLDRRIVQDATLAAVTRANVRARATLYATAVVALSDMKECRGIECPSSLPSVL